RAREPNSFPTRRSSDLGGRRSPLSSNSAREQGVRVGSAACAYGTRRECAHCGSSWGHIALDAKPPGTECSQCPHREIDRHEPHRSEEHTSELQSRSDLV